MKRAEMLKALNSILQRREGDLNALQATINALQISIREIESVDDAMFTKPQKGTFREEINRGDARCAKGWFTASQYHIGKDSGAWYPCWWRHSHSGGLPQR